jgi:hypothetical protein
MGYDGTWDKAGSDDCQGRAMRALAMATRSSDQDMAAIASEYFRQMAPTVRSMKSPRAWAHAIVACSNYLEVHADSIVLDLAADLGKALNDLFLNVHGPEWRWFESSLTYENALLSHGLIEAGLLGGKDSMLRHGLDSLSWLCEIQTSRAGFFAPIGSNGFYPRGGTRAWYDQQPIEAMATVAACLAATRTSPSQAWLDEAERARMWFLGENTEGLAMADEETGRCFDGLHQGRVNQNSGAESTIAYIMVSAELAAHKAMRKNARLA